MAKKEIIIGVTGSVAAYKACDIISKLKKAGHNITAIMTKEAAEFITALLLQSIDRKSVV